MKTRIAAAACAAITAVCGMQAMSASAFNHCYPYTYNTQEGAFYTIGHDLYLWQCYGMPQNSYWNKTVKAGTMVGKGFTNSKISSYTTNQNLYNNMAFPRFLAASHFGMDQDKAAWIELPKAGFTAYGHYQGGDQIFLKNGNSWHCVFVESANSNTFYCSELDSNNHVQWGVQYKLLSNQRLKRVSDGKIYNVQYVARPVKEGDADGSGMVNRDDVIWIEQRVANNYGNPNVSGCNNDLRKAAADVDGSGWLTLADSQEIYGHMYESRGIMTGDYRFALTDWLPYIG